MGLMSATRIARHSLAEADTRVQLKCRSQEVLTTHLKTSHTGRFARSGTTPKSQEPGGMRSSICRPTTTRKRKRVIRCSTFSTVEAKTRQDGFDKATQISFWII